MSPLSAPNSEEPSGTSRVLVLDADQRSALATIRSLGSRGVEIVAADQIPNPLGASSRHCGQRLVHPSPDHQPTEFIAWLQDAVARHRIDLVMPMTEVTSRLILARAGEALVAKLPFASLETVELLSDKVALLDLAKDLDIPVPKSRVYEDAGSVDVDALTGTFPLVVKPALSRYLDGEEWVNTGVHIVADAHELRETLAAHRYLERRFMLQEFIEGEGKGIFAVYDHGEAVAFFAHRRIREKPPWGGVSVLCESVEPEPAMLALSKRLLDGASWHGVAMVEFKVAPDGTPYLMEVNTRFWGSLQLAIDSGVDFPHLLHQIAIGQRPTTMPRARIGRRLRWLLGDLDALYLTLRDGKRYDARAKRKRLIEFLTPDFGRTRHEIFRWSDPAPAWREFVRYLDALRG